MANSRSYFDLWEADRDTTDAAKSYKELPSKVHDYSRRIELDSSAKKKMQRGGDTMDVGAAGGWSWYVDGSGDSSEVHEGAYAVGFKGKGKGK